MTNVLMSKCDLLTEENLEKFVRACYETWNGSQVPDEVYEADKSHPDYLEFVEAVKAGIKAVFGEE